MRCWKPRRPSPKLKRRLFAGHNAREREVWAPLSWNSFAPVMAILLLAVASFSDRHVTQPGSYNAMTALVLSNRTAASYYTSPDAFDRNSPPADTFASTKRKRSTSSIGSFVLFNTNGLMR